MPQPILKAGGRGLQTASLLLLFLFCAVTSGAAAASCDRAAFRAVIDVGHTPEAPGAVSARGVTEFDFSLRLGQRIDRVLRKKGFGKTVLLVTRGQALPALAERVSRANRMRAGLFVSIHHDSVPDALIEKWEYEGAEGSFSDRFRGHSIFVSGEHPQYAQSLAFARLLGLAMKAQGVAYTTHYTEKLMGARRRELVDKEAGVYRFDRLVVLKDTTMPAVLFEAGSIINRDEELVMQSPERQALIAEAVAEAIEGFCTSRRSRVPAAAK